MVGYGAAACDRDRRRRGRRPCSLAGGEDAGSEPGNAGNVFPSGGSFPKQKVFDLEPAAAGRRAASCRR